MADRQLTGQSLFLPLAPGRRYRTTSAGLVLPDQSWTAARLGLVPIPEPNAWIGELTGAYLIASEYLAPCEAARGREFDRGGWTSALLALHPRDEYIYHLAALNHATNDMALLEAYQDRFMERVAPDVAKIARVALAGGIDGQRRRFLARQVVLLALRLVLVPPDPAQAADASLASGLANLDPETAAILLAHLAADSITQQRAADEPRFGGTAQSLAMEVIASHLFNERDDPGDLLARYRLLWTRYGSQLKGVQLRRQPVELLEEATGREFDDLTALGFAYYAAGLTHRPDTLVAVNAFANIAIGRPVIEQFLGLFSSTADELAEALRDCQLPWQMLPLAERPLLRAGDNVIVLDERYLLDRVTRGLYWPVHDQEKQHGEQARVLWTQAYGEMIENRAEDQLRQLAPPLVIPGASTFFTEEDLQRSFPSSKNTDAGIDFGADVVLAEIVSATVTVATRQTPDAASWRKDAEKIVMKKHASCMQRPSTCWPIRSRRLAAARAGRAGLPGGRVRRAVPGQPDHLARRQAPTSCRGTPGRWPDSAARPPRPRGTRSVQRPARDPAHHDARAHQRLAAVALSGGILPQLPQLLLRRSEHRPVRGTPRSTDIVHDDHAEPARPQARRDRRPGRRAGPIAAPSPRQAECQRYREDSVAVKLHDYFSGLLDSTWKCANSRLRSSSTTRPPSRPIPPI